MIPWSPLARGFLAGNAAQEGVRRNRAREDRRLRARLLQPSDFQVVDRVREIARKTRRAEAQIALAWILHQPVVTAPIIGATKLSHMEDAIAALEIKLDTAEITALEEPYDPHRIIGHK